MPPSVLQVPPNCDLTLGMVCTDKSEPGRTTWTMTADERFANPAGVMQGGLVAAFCDSAMGASAVTHAGGRRVGVANAELKVSFLAPVRTGWALTCRAEVVSGGASVAFVEASVWGTAPGGSVTEPVLVARASSTYLLRERTGPTRG